MPVKKRVVVIVLASMLMLAVGIGPGMGDAALAVPEPRVEQVGATIPYAGRLNDETGTPVADGSYDFVFALYDTQAGGEPLWSEVQQGIVVSTGAFRVTLGSVEPLPAAVLDDQNRWLAVSVRGSGEAEFTVLNPRQELIAAAPAALSRPAASGACPHDHFGEVWTGSSTTEGLLIHNDGTGNGLYVAAHGSNGVLVESAGVGVHVYEAGSDGVYVSTAGEDGVHVSQAGDPSAQQVSSYYNGFEVAGAQGSGLYVGHADLDGVTVQSADWYGLYVAQSDDDGVRVDGAGGSGVYAMTVSATEYGGMFANLAAGGAGLYAAGGDNTAPDLVLGVRGSGDDGRIYSAPQMTGSDLLMFSNDEFHIHLDEDNNSTSSFAIYNGANTAVFSVDESGAVTFGSQAGVFGTRAVHAVQATGSWIEDFGAAQLEDGQATVAIEPVFAQTVDLSEYHVFLTPLGDCPLFVADKTAASFTVQAMGGQRCSIAFDYRLVAMRLGDEEARLEALDGDREEEDD